MEYVGTSVGRIKQRDSENIKMGHRSVERDVRKDIRTGTTDGSVTKGDGPHQYMPSLML